MSKLGFGKVQLKIMQVIWEKQPVSAVDITATLNKEREIAHSTVQTHLRDLLKKEAIAYNVDDRTFLYYSLVDAESAKKHAVTDMIHRVFSGSAEGLVAYLVSNEYVEKPALEKMMELMNEVNDPDE